MKIAAAQISCSLGDVEANIRKIAEFARTGEGIGRGVSRFSGDG